MGNTPMSNSLGHSPEFMDKLAMEAIGGRKTIHEMAADHADHHIQVGQ